MNLHLLESLEKKEKICPVVIDSLENQKRQIGRYS